MKSAVVLDLGSDTIKAGFSNSQCPQYMLPNVLGRQSESKSKALCCDRAMSSNLDLNLSYPLQKTNVLNWAFQILFTDHL